MQWTHCKWHKQPSFDVQLCISGHRTHATFSSIQYLYPRILLKTFSMITERSSQFRACSRFFTEWQTSYCMFTQWQLNYEPNTPFCLWSVNLLLVCEQTVTIVLLAEVYIISRIKVIRSPHAWESMYWYHYNASVCDWIEREASIRVLLQYHSYVCTYA